MKLSMMKKLTRTYLRKYEWFIIYRAPSPADTGIDLSSFRVGSTIEKWRDRANEKTYANVCEMMDRQEEEEESEEDQEQPEEVIESEEIEEPEVISDNNHQLHEFIEDSEAETVASNTHSVSIGN